MKTTKWTDFNEKRTFLMGIEKAGRAIIAGFIA